MSKSSKILVSGDSFSSFDYQLYDEKLYEKMGHNINTLPFEFPKYDCWPLVLSKKLNKEVINASKPGAGNFSICKRAQDYVMRNHKDIELCIIGLSEWTRVEDVFLSRASETVDNFMHLDLVEKMDIPEAFKKQATGRLMEKFAFINDFRNKYRKKFFYGIFRNNSESLITNCTTGRIDDIYNNESKLIYNTLRAIYELQTICKNLGIKCLFFQFLSPIRETIYDMNINLKKEILNSIITNPYFSMIDKKNTIGFPFLNDLGGYNLFEKFILDRPEYSIGPVLNPKPGSKPKQLERKYDYHPNAEGHKLIAEIIIKELKNI